MMRASLLVVAFAGCTHHYSLTEAHEVAGDEVELVGQYGQRVRAVGVASGGGLTFYDKANGGMVPPEEIHRIEDTRHLRGALEGLGIGGGIGAGLGIVIGLASGDDECTDDHGDCFFAFSAGDKAVIGAILLGGLGGAVGLIVGAMKGSTIIYERAGGSVSVRAGGDDGSLVTVSF